MIPSRKAGDAVLALLAAAPLAAALAATPGGSFADASAVLLFLGRATAILGLTALLLAALTAARIPGADAWFGGLTRLWKIHHLLGAAAFLLLMAHPLLLAFAATRTSAQAAAAVLYPPWSERSAWAGWAAFAALAAFLAPTFWFFGRPEYRRWKALHALSAAAVLLGLAHAFGSGRLLTGGCGRAIWASYGALALLAAGYRLVYARFFARAGCRVARVEKVGRGIVELTLTPDGSPLRHRAGQFVYLTPLDPSLAAGRGEEHPYTVSSAPGEPVLRIAIKDLGDASRALQTVTPGSRALVEGPYGDFFPAGSPPASELWIAGGVGVTPFLSRVRALTPDARADIFMIFCAQDETRAHFLPELAAAAERVPGFRLATHYFGAEGPLSVEFVRSRCPDFAGRESFICGPAPLIEGARALLRRAGVPRARIHSEDFTWL